MLTYIENQLSKISKENFTDTFWWDEALIW